LAGTKGSSRTGTKEKILMASGCCSGCGRTGSIRTISQHVTSCVDYQTLFAVDPESCLAPAAEYQRRRDAATPEERARLRDERLTKRFAELARQHRISSTRWQTPPDILS
jgi:hypothetical protein